MFVQPSIDKCHIDVIFWLISLFVYVYFFVYRIDQYILCVRSYRVVCVAFWKGAFKSIIWHYDKTNTQKEKRRKKEQAKKNDQKINNE